MKLTRTSLLLYACLIFASGVVLGVAGQRLYSVNSVSAKAAQHPDDWRKRYTAEMQTRLKLEPDQLTRLNAILDETRARFHEVRERSRPEMERVRREQNDKIRAMLTPAQQPQFDQLLEERDRRAKAKAGRTGAN